MGYFRTAVELVLSACAVRVAAHKGETFTRDQADRAHLVRKKLEEWGVLSEHEMRFYYDFYSFGSQGDPTRLARTPATPSACSWPGRWRQSSSSSS